MIDQLRELLDAAADLTAEVDRRVHKSHENAYVIPWARMGRLKAALAAFPRELVLHTHIASGGRSPDEKRFSARDVAAMMDVAVALYKSKESAPLQRVECSP